MDPSPPKAPGPIGEWWRVWGQSVLWAAGLFVMAVLFWGQVDKRLTVLESRMIDVREEVIMLRTDVHRAASVAR